MPLQYPLTRDNVISFNVVKRQPIVVSQEPVPTLRDVSDVAVDPVGTVCMVVGLCPSQSSRAQSPVYLPARLEVRCRGFY